jgi:CDGSH-type Zn-finger protein
MADTKISTSDNGSYWVSGNFVVVDAEGNEFPVTDEAYLCRCGQSEEKPFCDGTHNLVGFNDSCRA